MVFICRGTRIERIDPARRYTSSVASSRLRVLIPAVELARTTPVWLVPPQEVLRDPAFSSLGRPAAAVMTKFSTFELREQQAMFEAVLLLLERGKLPGRVLADFSDNLAGLAGDMNVPFLADYQRRTGQACALVACCASLADALRADAAKGVSVIEDPYESGRAGSARAPATAPLRLLWFGVLGDTNHRFVQQSLDGVLRECTGLDVELEFIASSQRLDLVEPLRAALTGAHARLRFAFTPWSLQAVDAALERCDVVLLPQDASREWGRTKSHNRLVAAIRAGRFAVASPIPSYQELGEFAWVGDSLAAGVQWAIGHPDEALTRIAAGQREIERRFSPQAVAARWCEVLGVPATTQ